MSLALWTLALAAAFLVVIVVSARVRKQVLIATTYISLTGWYYYRKWEKRSGAPPKRKSRTPSNKHLDDDADVRFFEPAEKVLQREEREERWSQHSASENSYRLSETSSSGQSEEPTAKNGASKGLFRKLRKSQREGQMDGSRVSDVSVSSNFSTTSRRTFSGRKKPASWGE